MQFNTKEKELTLKIVYYGPGLSGKTTNLHALHGMLDPGGRSRLMTLDTKGDRTLFFDLLPLNFTTRSGFKVKLKLFTVPGQVMHEATRRIVLAGTDGICFIADSQRSERANNNQAFRGMLGNLRANGIPPDKIPIVIQFNKRDLPNVQTDAELAEFEKRGKEPIYRAVAIKGEGVLETLEGCLQIVWKKLNAEHDFRRRLGITREEFMRSIFSSMRPSARMEVQP